MHSAFGEGKRYLGTVGHWEKGEEEYAHLSCALGIASCS